MKWLIRLSFLLSGWALTVASMPASADSLSNIMRASEPVYQYRSELEGAVLKKDQTHSEIVFTLKLAPKTDKDNQLLTSHAQDLLSLVHLDQFVFTLYDGGERASEPGVIYPWQHANRIRFFLVMEESRSLSLKNHTPTIVVKLMYPNYVLKQSPSIKVEDLERGSSATIHVK